MLREEIEQVKEIAMIEAKTASITATEALMEKISVIESRLDKLERTSDKPEPVAASKKAAKKEAE